MDRKIPEFYETLCFVAGLGVGVIPYLPGDTAKIIIAIIAGPQIRKAVSRFM